MISESQFTHLKFIAWPKLYKLTGDPETLSLGQGGALIHYHTK